VNCTGIEHHNVPFGVHDGSNSHRGQQADAYPSRTGRGGGMDGARAVKTMKLRYAGVCVGCDAPLPAGIRAHYLPPTKTVRCLDCGPTEAPPVAATEPPKPPPPSPSSRLSGAPGPAPTFVAWPPESSSDSPARDAQAETVLSQGELPRAAPCGDCGRNLRRGAEALHDRVLTEVLCLECVTLDTVHSLGTPGAGARREHARRLDRHQTRVRTAHPRLGGLILALADDPQHVRAWQTGAVGEEEFGRRLSGCSGPQLKVLHDRKIPRSSANIDHLAVTTEAVWVLDAKRYKGRVETRGGGLLSARPPELYVGGRNQTKLVEGVKRQVAIVHSLLSPLASELGIAVPPEVRGALVFIDAEFGLFTSPFVVDDVWVGWGKAIRKRLGEEATGRHPVDEVAKRLARELRAG
jgi:hypothetical protein